MKTGVVPFLIITITVLSAEQVVCPSCMQTSIKAAVAQAQSGDTIRVQAGQYDEWDIVIDKPLVLLGQGATIDANRKGGIFEVLADSVTLSGFNLERTEISFTKDIAAIYGYRMHDFTFENLTINDAQFAFLIHKSSRGIIRNNTISGETRTEATGGNGIHLWYSNQVEITGNSVTGMRDGIYFEFVENSVIADNHSHHNVRYGLHFMFSNHNTYTRNRFEENGAGVAVMFSRDIVMEDNLFRHNWGTAAYGLLLKEIYDGKITSNRFIQNTIGINVEGSSRVEYRYNTLEKNGWGVKVTGGCYDNEFTRNDFLNNTFDVSYFGTLNSNSFNGNHWSDYTGYDLNHDGVGDILYRPIKLFSHIVSQAPEAIILVRSLFVDIVNYSEKVTPVFTSSAVKDDTPVMSVINGDRP